MFYDKVNSLMDYSNRMTGLMGYALWGSTAVTAIQDIGGTCHSMSVPESAERRCEIQGQERHWKNTANWNQTINIIRRMLIK